MNPRTRIATGIVAFFALALILIAQAMGADKPLPVTPLEGDSWLTHIGRRLEDTSMGKTGRWGPIPGPQASLIGESSITDAGERTLRLTGSDLYRMNCRGCHGEAGLGAPPEINSVINPVRSTSARAIMERMKTAGMPMSQADANKLAKQSEAALLQRLHHGGENMPSFSYLSEEEIRALYSYLTQLAGVPGAESKHVAINEPSLRAGELIVKSTCHICHGATGTNPSPQQILEGTIPPPRHADQADHPCRIRQQGYTRCAHSDGHAAHAVSRAYAGVSLFQRSGSVGCISLFVPLPVLFQLLLAAGMEYPIVNVELGPVPPHQPDRFLRSRQDSTNGDGLPLALLLVFDLLLFLAGAAVTVLGFSRLEKRSILHKAEPNGSQTDYRGDVVAVLPTANSETDSELPTAS